MRQSRCLRGDSFEYIVYEAVHNAHGFAGDPGVRMYLLQYFVDVNSVALLPLPFFLLIGLTDILLSLSGLLYGFTTRFRRHSRQIESTCRLNHDTAFSTFTGIMCRVRRRAILYIRTRESCSEPIRTPDGCRAL